MGEDIIEPIVMERELSFNWLINCTRMYRQILPLVFSVLI